MSTRKNRRARARKAQNERWDFGEWCLHINTQPHLRTLKASARRKLKQQHALHLRIIPWLHDPTWRSQGHMYSPVTFLGLPNELRQHILYQTCHIASLEGDFGAELEKQGDTNRTQPFVSSDHMSLSSTEELNLDRRKEALRKCLGRRIGLLCSVAPLVRLDMQFVSQLWRRDLGRYIKRELRRQPKKADHRLPERFQMMAIRGMTVRERERERGSMIEAKNSKVPGTRFRPHKCWYCTERHRDGDPVCPPARKNPEKWHKMTKKIGGWRGSAQPRQVWKGKKTVFDD